MLSTKFTHLLTTNPGNRNISCRPIIPSRHFSIKWIDLLTRNGFHNVSVMDMSCVKFRIFVRNLVVARLFSGWARSFVVNSVIKRCRRDRAVRDVWLRFRQAVLRPKHTLLFTTVGAAYKNNEEKPGVHSQCSKDISDAEMQALIADIESMEELAKATLFCVGCAKRVVIDSKQPGVRYCTCENAQPPVRSYDGWEPYMEAEDVIIWRKEYKPGGLYAYKVYGRYKHIKAEDFAAIQMDGAYRKVWDTAVASLSVVERTANGKDGQDVLHWEVLWPRLFANRDYVYLRRHKEFAVKESCMAHKEAIFEDEPCGPVTGSVPNVVPVSETKEHYVQKPCVHSAAKLKSQQAEAEAEAQAAAESRGKPEAESRGKIEAESRGKPEAESRGKIEAESGAKQMNEPVRDMKSNDPESRVYVIVSRSCKHPQVPETNNAIRVSEYWSHMVIKTINGPDKEGMEFVLTYYDEPAVGGLPTAVMSWAMGRAGPAFLDRMRKAAIDYQTWKKKTDHEDTPIFTPGPTKVSYANKEIPRSEQDMETSNEGPELSDEKNAQSKEIIVTQEQKTTPEKELTSEKTNLTSDKELSSEKTNLTSQTEVASEKTNLTPENEATSGKANLTPEKNSITEKTNLEKELSSVKTNLTSEKTNLTLEKSSQKEVTSEKPNLTPEKEVALEKPNLTSEKDTEVTKEPEVVIVKDVKDIKDVKDMEKSFLNKPVNFGVAKSLDEDATASKSIDETNSTPKEPKHLTKKTSIIITKKDSEPKNVTKPITISTEQEKSNECERDGDTAEEERESERAAWWRYLYPPYYFA